MFNGLLCLAGVDNKQDIGNGKEAADAAKPIQEVGCKCCQALSDFDEISGLWALVAITASHLLCLTDETRRAL